MFHASPRFRSHLSCLALALASVSSSLPLAAAEGGGQSYLGMTLGYIRPDNDRMTDRSGVGVQALYGWQVKDRWYLETRLFGSVLETGADVPGVPANGTAPDFYQIGAGVDVQYALGDRLGLTPFVLAGIGGVYDDVVPDDRDALNAYLNLGAGVVTAPMGGSGMKLRAELRYLYDAFEGGMQDLQANIGVEVPLHQPVPCPAPTRGSAATPVIAVAPIDSDLDGVSNPADNCPDSLPGTAVDTAGCAVRDQIINLHGVNFEFDSARLTINADRILDLGVKALAGDAGIEVEIAGHTDAVGDAVYNQQLSQSRAEAVRDYLVAHGVDAARLQARGYGESQPIASNADVAGRARNRRVEFRVRP